NRDTNICNMDPTRPRLAFRRQADFPNSFPTQPWMPERQHWYRDLGSMSSQKLKLPRVLLCSHPMQPRAQGQHPGGCGKTRIGLTNISPGGRYGPQGLEPALLSVLNGTAEAVPYPKPFMRPVLGVRGRTGDTTGNTEGFGWIKITAMPERGIGQLACLPLLHRGEGNGDHAAIDGIENQYHPGEFF